MVRQDDIVVASLLRGSCHLGDFVTPVAPVAVRMQVATQILLLNQTGQRTAGRQLDLAASLAEFGWDPGAANGGINVLFGRAVDGLAHPLRARPQLEVVCL